MKKQINPSIKAHVLWSTLILLSLLAICALPFALAQRNTAKPSAAIAHQPFYQGDNTSYSDVPFLKPQMGWYPTGRRYVYSTLPWAQRPLGETVETWLLVLSGPAHPPQAALS